MLKRYKTMLIITSLLIMLPVLAGIALWNDLPEQMPIHWNATGEPDGYGSKTFAILFFPALILAVHWLCILVTAAAPKKENITREGMRLVLCICPAVSIFASTLMYCWALGYKIPIETIVPAAVGCCLVIIGLQLPKVKQNYTIGIKLPWTLNDEDNWKQTHKFAGIIWPICGATMIGISLLQAVLKRIVEQQTAAMATVYATYGVLLAIILLAPTVYSYKEYKKKIKCTQK